MDLAPRPVRPSLGAPIRLDTRTGAAQSPSHLDPSPSAGLYQGHPPSLQPHESSNSDVSPKTERLPSFRHISKIADAATHEANHTVTFPLPVAAPSSYPPPPVSGQSPTIPQQPYATNMHAPHASPYAFGQPTAPPAGYGDFYYAGPTSPSVPYAANLYHQARRQSHSHLYGAVGSQPPALVSMNTNSSSGAESYPSHHSSLSEAVSTARTTPLDSDMQLRAPAPILPAPQHIQTATHTTQSSTGPWACDHPGCTASPFPTQYLLSSHSTSHSSSRPHYCSVPGCPRGQGGRGFKRKNEMIRHGLTHDTPGYICPFCPAEKCHRYPRPDNLQRHVRVRHLDKDRDDSLLKEVLSQRPGLSAGAARGHAASASLVEGVDVGSGSEGGGKGKRRRKTGP